MCGIAGIASYNAHLVEQDKLHKMATAIKHRGIDGEGFWINNSTTVGFAHRRLSVIDLSENAAQPMHYSFNNNQYTIVFNGEIYNYIELKNELIKKGYTFSTNSDTEVLLALYDCYQEKCLPYIDGMFAFAIWNEQERKIFIARDRFGEKPLYYYHDKEQFIFASEMKALWSVGIEKQINHRLLLAYLSAGFVSNPSNASETFYTNIKKLPAAHALIFKVDKNDLFVYKYWQPEINTSKYASWNEEKIADHFYALLIQSVQRRLRSDVAIGTCLSGGLDSSSIVAIINEISTKNNHQQPKTFSAVFPDFEKDETKFIQLVKNEFNVENFTKTPTAQDFLDDFEKLIYHQEEPFQSSSIYVQYKIYELAKKHNVTVLLDGQGADEMLAGYTKYYHWYWQELLRKFRFTTLINEIDATKKNYHQVEWNYKNYLAAFLPNLASKKLSSTLQKQINNHPFLAADFIHSSFDKSIIEKPVVKQLNDILHYNTFQFGLEDLLRYADRNSMAHGREVRLPFLQYELVEFIFSLPAKYKIQNGFTKHILRQSMIDKLPSKIVWRKDKIGYEPPQQQWMQHNAIKDLMQEAKQKLMTNGIVKKELMNRNFQPSAAHEANNYSWWILCAGNML
ncbi:MAG: asparagine synthase (glutamine-hydrolyzing) [Chitinophagaceae bacterium]|nr:asparagine synthase (glutamine-hydrolyzing) [Chitinophagaceae bacterium]MCW5905238.1 asparagine synthase (glutamine-hydrolyzing) [Chitinophagaceae bacterium]